MKTLQHSEGRGGKYLVLAIFSGLGLSSYASDNVSKALYKDLTGTGNIGFYIIGGIIVGGLILHIIVNHIIKPKEDDSSQKPPQNIPHHHHHHHHHGRHQVHHRIVKKTP